MNERLSLMDKDCSLQKDPRLTKTHNADLIEKGKNCPNDDKKRTIFVNR
jgi:hypothetical protein